MGDAEVRKQKDDAKKDMHKDIVAAKESQHARAQAGATSAPVSRERHVTPMTRAFVKMKSGQKDDSFFDDAEVDEDNGPRLETIRSFESPDTSSPRAGSRKRASRVSVTH